MIGFSKQSLRFLLLGAILFTLFYPSFGQDSLKLRRDRKRSFTLFSDSGATQAEYMLHLEGIYQKIDSIQNESGLTAEVIFNGQQLKECDSVINFVKESLVKYDQTLNIRNLEMLKILLEEAQDDLRKYTKNFKTSYSKLSKLKEEIRELRRDSLLRQLIKDTVTHQKFLSQLQDLRVKRRNADSLLMARLSVINDYKTNASRAAILSTQLMGKLNKQLSSASAKVFAKELNYLWEAPEQAEEKREGIVAVFKEEQVALNFYYTNSKENRFVRWLIGFGFLFWVFRNIRTLKRKDKMDTLKHYQLTDLTSQPIASAFAVIFSIAPLFDLHAPAAYVQLVQFLLIIALTFLYRKQWSKQLFYYWLGVVALFFLFTFANHMLVPSFWQRCGIIALNIIAAGLAIIIRKSLPRDIQLRGFLRIVLLVQVFLHVLAIVNNLYGRWTLSQMFGTTAVFSTIQLFGLSMLVKILLEAVVLQIHTSRVRLSIENTFNASFVIENFRKPLLWMVVFIWLIVFSTSLNIYDSLFESFAGALRLQHDIGNISFTYGSVLLFFLIIWLAHFLQKYVSYFLGDIGDDENEGLAQRSKLVMTRLIVLGIGYLLAVAASGVPVDKITIVLGALGVGIGLGLQNIVNNFVSGIILIFDRPLKVGDTVEVGEHSGRVREIGLRSSTLVTVNGADVIIPNGDILSRQIVNWTHNNSFKRIELTLTVQTKDNKDTLVALIKELVKSADNVLKKREPVVLVESIKDEEYVLNIFFWCEDFYKAEQTKSEVRYLIYQEFKENGIGLK